MQSNQSNTILKGLENHSGTVPAVSIGRNEQGTTIQINLGNGLSTHTLHGERFEGVAILDVKNGHVHTVTPITPQSVTPEL